MKHLTTFLLIILSINIYSQKVIPLDPVNEGESVLSGKSIIYGTFIQRLGFSSGGFPQDIRIVNKETNEIFAFRVKQAYKSAKENSFCFHIIPGNYYIMNYWWTQSKWYGGQMHYEQIFKGVDSSNKPSTDSELEKAIYNSMNRFEFTISNNTINYLGTWHFDTGIVSFTNDKARLDSTVMKEFTKIDFESAQLTIPK